MPDDRYKTTLEIGVDDKEVRRLGETIHRALETEPITRFRRSIEELTAQIVRMNAESQRAAGIPPSGPGAPRPSGMPPIPQPPQRGPQGPVGAPGGQGQPPGFFRQAAATGAGVMGAQMFQRMGGVAPAMARGQGAVGAAMGAIPIIGPILQAAFGSAQQFAGQYGAFGQQLAPMGGMAGIGGISKAATGKAAGLGIAKPQLAQQIGPLAQRMGMRGKGTAETVAQLLGIERVTGIQSGQMAGLVGAGGIGAGQGARPKEAIDTIADVISAGLEAGIRKQKLGEFMGEIASNVTALRRQGISVDAKSMAGFVAGVSKYGASFKGAAGTQAAGNMLSAIRGAGERNDFGAMLVMQTAMEQGRDPYEAMEALEDPKQAQKILPAMIEKVRRMGGSTEAKALALRQAMQGKLTYVQARQAIETEAGGKFEDVDRGRANEFIKEQRQVTQKSRGVVMQEAALTNQRLAIGAEVFAPVKKVEAAELEVAKIVAPEGAKVAKGIVKQVREGLKAAKALEAEIPIADVSRAEGTRELAGTKVEELLGGILEVIKSVARGFGFETGIKTQTHRGVVPPPGTEHTAGQNEP